MAQTRTALTRSWTLKMAIFASVFLFFGVWGLVDALYFYPRRGEADASLRLYHYLQAADEARRLHTVGVEDPRAELEQLEQRAREARRTGSGSLSDVEQAKYEWLRSLQRLWQLDSAPERIEPDRQTQLAQLRQRWERESPPKPLSGLDLAFQWVFVVVGFGGGIWMLGVLARASRTVYRWDPDHKRLTLPDNTSITPDDLSDVDKRKWHRYFVTLILKDGRTLKLDLLRYSPLEQWILELERTAFPDRADDADTDNSTDSPEPATDSDPAPEASPDDTKDADAPSQPDQDSGGADKNA